MCVAMQIAMLGPRPASLPADLESAVRGKDWQSAATRRQRSGNVKLALDSHAAQAKRSYLAIIPTSFTHTMSFLA